MESVFREDLLKDRIAVVTGASRGIGKAIAIELAKVGAIVILVGRDIDSLDNVKKEISIWGRRCEVIKTDVSSIKQVEEMFEFIEGRFGKLHILVNAAGVSPHYTSFHKSPTEDWYKILNTNLIGIFHCCKYAFPLLCKSEDPAIVSVSSIGGVVGLPKVAVYSASKGAIVTFTKSLSIEWAPFNIRVNAVCPGFVETDMTRGLLSKQDLKGYIISKIPLKRIAKPSEIANAVLFLVSPASSYITGQCLIVDGGWTAE